MIFSYKLHTIVGNSNKLSPQFKGPYKVIAPDSGNKFKIRHLDTGDVIFFIFFIYFFFFYILALSAGRLSSSRAWWSALARLGAGSLVYSGASYDWLMLPPGTHS